MTDDAMKQHVIDENNSSDGGSRKSKMFSVYVRFRPLNEREKRERGESCVDPVMSDDRTVVVNGNGIGSYGGALSFKFDRIFYEDAGQNRIFEECVQERLETFIASTQDCNVLSYGQTSSGKTWTIDGDFYRDDRRSRDSDNVTNMGIMPRTLERLCSRYGRDMTVSCYEIYCEKIFDLLRPSDRACKFSEINDTIAVDVTRDQCPPDVECSAYEYYARLLRRANKNRHFASTAMNSTSSRSHTFIEFVCPTTKATQRTAAVAAAKRNGTRDSTTRPAATSKIFRVIDLAGSERAAKTLAKDQVLQEGININNSLMYLKQMVEIISQKSVKSLPKYRDSKLTRIIYSSIKNHSSSVVLLLCCSPSNTNANETISTLRFGSTATKITKLATLTRDEETTVAARPTTVVYANGISPLENENLIREERQRNLLELQRLESKLREERDQERRDFEQRISEYERQIEQLTLTDKSQTRQALHGDHENYTKFFTATNTDRQNQDDDEKDAERQLDILRVTRETYAQCRDTIELQRKIIDELTQEKQRLNEQIRVYDLFKAYMLSNMDVERIDDSDDDYDVGDQTYDSAMSRDGNSTTDYVNLGTILDQL